MRYFSSQWEKISSNWEGHWEIEKEGERVERKWEDFKASPKTQIDLMTRDTAGSFRKIKPAKNDDENL